MAYHRRVFSHKNSWSNVSINMATIRAPSLQASGDTTINLYHSHFAWTISVVSMLAANMLNTSPPFSASRCSHDWDGQRYLGMTIDWDYTGRAVHASMLDYIPKALTCFQHPTPRIPQHQPYPHVKPTYGAKAQYTEDMDSSPPLDKQGKKYIQEVIGTLLYYAHCVDNTMLPALGSLATQQANPTQNTHKIVQ